MWLITCEEYLATVESRMRGLVTSQKRPVAFVCKDLNLGLKLIHEYSRQYKKKYCPGDRGMVVEFRLLGVVKLPDDTDLEALKGLEVEELTLVKIQRMVEG